MIIGLLNGCLNKINRIHIHNARNRGEQKYLVNHDYPEITDDELKQVQQAWPYMNLTKKDLTWSRIYKKEHGFSPYFVGVWQSFLLREVFNPYDQLSSFENKALTDIYFPELPFPKAYIRRIQGVYYDAAMSLLSEDEAVAFLASKLSYIIKPAFGTMQGKGVQKISLSGNRDEDEKLIRKSFKEHKSDFIVQEVVRQHPDVAALNPTSLNCCRVTTIYINGKSGFSTILKIGRKGSDVDNWHSSYMVGVSDDGVLNDYAYDYELKRVDKTDLGQSFGGFRLPCFAEMIELVESSHKRLFPNCGMVGWDVFVDENNKPRVIEANITKPGLVGEQLCSGTFLESFCNEINERMKQNLRK